MRKSVPLNLQSGFLAATHRINTNMLFWWVPDQVEIVVGGVLVAQPRNANLFIAISTLNYAVPNYNFIACLHGKSDCS